MDSEKFIHDIVWIESLFVTLEDSTFNFGLEKVHKLLLGQTQVFFLSTIYVGALGLGFLSLGDGCSVSLILRFGSETR